MEFKEQVLKIAEDFNKSIKERIDQLLEQDATMYTNLGINSTNKDKAEVKRNSKIIYKAIDKIDPYTGKLLLNHLDV
jgi:hypothetical protein